MIKILVGLHVLMGSIAVAGMITAWATKKGALWHRRGGKAYVVGMAGALLLAFIVSVATSNVFLFFVGLFSAYFVYTGYRLAVARDSVRNHPDKSVSILMMVIGLAMFAFSAYIYSSDSSMAIILIVFGIIGIGQGYNDFRRGDKWPTGKERIALHLNRMGGASIATITAVFVVNVQTNPAWIAWLLPGVVGSFVINYWTKRTLAPTSKEGT